jgi:polyphosphate kinase
MKNYLKDVLLAAYLRDNVKARQLQIDGTYAKVQLAPDEEPFDSQAFFIERDADFQCVRLNSCE